jgi:predicted Zn-dependent protease
MPNRLFKGCLSAIRLPSSVFSYIFNGKLATVSANIRVQANTEFICNAVSGVTVDPDPVVGGNILCRHHSGSFRVAFLTSLPSHPFNNLITM